LRPAIERGSIEIALGIEGQRAESGIVPVAAVLTNLTEIVEHSLGAIRGKLKYGSRARSAAVGGPIEVATIEGETGFGVGTIGVAVEAVEHGLSAAAFAIGGELENRPLAVGTSQQRYTVKVTRGIDDEVARGAIPVSRSEEIPTTVSVLARRYPGAEPPRRLSQA